MDINLIGNQYKIIEKIGSGGMATVYKGVNIRNHQIVAIKSLNGEFLSSDDVIRRFRREAEAAYNLDNRNICKVYDFIEEGGAYYIIMEYIEGKTLRMVMKEKKVIPDDIVALVAYSIANALKDAHREGVVHRDLKPDNIMVGTDGVVKVMDFGIAKIEESSGDLTKTGMMIGTPSYMSKEQITGEKDIDGRTDIFSLGIILYKMMFRDNPYGITSEDSAGAIYKKLEENRPRTPKPFPKSKLYKLITTAIASEKIDRQENIYSFIDDLTRTGLSFKNLDMRLALFLSSDEVVETRKTITKMPIPREIAGNKNIFEIAIFAVFILATAFIIWGVNTHWAAFHK